MFKGGSEELFPFLLACDEYNCSVYFENEKISYEKKPLTENGMANVELAIYASIANDPKMVNDYIRYLGNFEAMKWENVSYEPILKAEQTGKGDSE
jgi:hypothetical protein